MVNSSSARFATSPDTGLADPPEKYLTASRIGIRTVPRHVWVALTAWLSGLINAGVMFATIRMLTVALGDDGYATFTILTGLLSWFYLLDFGLASSLQNQLSEHRALGKATDSHIVTAVTFVASVIVLFTIVMLTLAPFLAQGLLGRFDGLSFETRRLAFRIATCAFSIGALGNLGFRIWYAELHGYRSNLCISLAALIGLAGIFALIQTGDELQLEWVICWQVLPLMAVSLLAVSLVTLRAFRKGGRFRLPILRDMLARSIRFWLFTLMGVTVLGLDYMLMSQLLPARQIVLYNVVSKMSGFVLFFYSAVLTAAWPAIAELATRRRWEDIRHHVQRHVMCGLAFAALSTVAFAVWQTPIIALVAPAHAGAIPTALVLMFGGYVCIRVWTDTYVNLLLALGHNGPLLKIVPWQAVANVGLQVLLIQILGMYGAILGLCGSYLLTVSWVAPRAAFAELRRQDV